MSHRAQKLAIHGRVARGAQGRTIMSLIRTAKLNGHNSYAYLHDVLTPLPTHKNRDLGDLLPHRWQPTHGPVY